MLEKWWFDLLEKIRKWGRPFRLRQVTTAMWLSFWLAPFIMPRWKVASLPNPLKISFEDGESIWPYSPENRSQRSQEAGRGSLQCVLYPDGDGFLLFPVHRWIHYFLFWYHSHEVWDEDEEISPFWLITTRTLGLAVLDQPGPIKVS